MSPTGIRKPFEEVRMYADVPWFPLNGWRHTAITRLAEQGRPMAFIKKKSGHVTDQMCEHYTHISEQAELAWVEKNTHRRQPVSVSSYPLRRAG
jgi:integrase